MDEQELRDRWPPLVSGQPELRDRVLAAYSAPGRSYHDLTHLVEVLDRLEELLPPSYPHRDAVVLAAWFHDAAYDTTPDEGQSEPDDEERSARLAETELLAAGVTPGLVGEVARLVRLTADHRPEPGDLAGALLCDADLAILAAGNERYAAYVRGVRAEYAEVPDEVFRRGRAGVLRGLLDKEHLFETEAARRRWESRARANLARELATLEPAD